MKKLLLILLSISLLTGCYTPPVVPDSVVPLSCQIGMTEHFYENGVYSRSVYTYDPFGQLTRQYHWWGKVTDVIEKGNVSDTKYTYDAEHYLVKRTEGTESPMVYTYEYEGSPRRLRRITSGTYEELYTYEGGRLTKLTKSSNGQAFSTYLYGADGKLVSLDNKPQTYEITNGAITRIVYSDQSYLLLERNGAGQESKFTYGSPFSLRRQVYEYSFSDKPILTDSQLRFRGIPDVPDGRGKRGLLLSQTHQVVEVNKPTQTVYDLRYTYAYNAQGLPTGYTTTTGERAKYYYLTCPNQ